MGRRKGELTQLMEVASKWPWWVSAALVPVSYGVFHLIAAAFAQVIAPSNPADLGQVVIQQGIHTFATSYSTSFPLSFSLRQRLPF